MEHVAGKCSCAEPPVYLLHGGCGEVHGRGQSPGLGGWLVGDSPVPADGCERPGYWAAEDFQAGFQNVREVSGDASV